MGETRITEVKRHLDGRVERFDCALVRRSPHVFVVRFDHERGRRVSGARVPAGSRSLGFFWRRRSYLLYRFEAPDTSLIGHRFDVVEGVRLGEREVSYLDLLLDVWIPAGGRPAVEDEEDVVAASRARLITREQRQRIEAAKDLLLRRWNRIAREADRLLAG